MSYLWINLYRIKLVKSANSVVQCYFLQHIIRFLGRSHECGANLLTFQLPAAYESEAQAELDRACLIRYQLDHTAVFGNLIQQWNGVTSDRNWIEFYHSVLPIFAHGTPSSIPTQLADREIRSLQLVPAPAGEEQRQTTCGSCEWIP